MADITNQEVLEGITELISHLADTIVTKDEFEDRLQTLATKQDLERYVTKDDLKRFATKMDLRHFTTKADLGQMEMRLTRKLDGHRKTDVRRHLTIRQEIGHLNRKFDNLQESLQAGKLP